MKINEKVSKGSKPDRETGVILSDFDLDFNFRDRSELKSKMKIFRYEIIQNVKF